MAGKVKKNQLKKAEGSGSPKAAPAGSPKLAPAGSPKASPKAAPGDPAKVKLAAEAVEEILKGIAQPDSQKHAAFIPATWHTKYKDALGSYKKFIKSQSDKLAVVDKENGVFVIMKPGDKGVPPAGKPDLTKGGDWKKALTNAWNIYCKAVPKHEWSVEVFTSALPKGPRSTKPEADSSAKTSSSQKVAPAASPKAAPAASPKAAPAAAPAGGDKKAKKKAGKK